MPDFWLYFSIGLQHVLDIHAYDHVLFLIALSVPYAFKDWKKLLILVSVFTIGHTLSLVLSVFEIVLIKASLVEFLIPITIIITALYHLFTTSKNTKKERSLNIIAAITLFFGIIHGLGFSNYFKTILPGNPSDKVFPLLQFALGIEAAQLIVVLVFLLLSYTLQNFFRVSKRDWAIAIAAFVIGVALPMVLASEVWQ